MTVDPTPFHCPHVGSSTKRPGVDCSECAALIRPQHPHPDYPPDQSAVNRIEYDDPVVPPWSQRQLRHGNRHSAEQIAAVVFGE